MALSKIKDDAFIMKIRGLFRSTYGHDLDVVLTPDGDKICNDAFFVRAVNYNNCMMPWIESAFSLSGASVVEIGCGTGAATLALAQRCSQVESFDIDPVSLNLARERAAFAEAENVHFHLLDPQWALPERIVHFRDNVPGECDVVVLPAVLEHLRMNERLAVLETMWGLLRSHGIMVVYDTPNRLYGFDVHSFRLPFFNWLPDDLALMYASRSPRVEFPPILAKAASPMETLYRLGRGVSYHEFDLAIGLSEFEVINDGYSRLLTHRQINDGFEGVLMDLFERFSPHIPPAFSKQYLEMVLQKRWHKVDLVQRHLVKDYMLEGKRPALVIEGEDSRLQYSVANGNSRRLLIEVLKHPWSSVLLACDEAGHPFYQSDLYSEYGVTEVLNFALPENVRQFQLRVNKSTLSQGNQAWILGVGSDL